MYINNAWELLLSAPASLIVMLKVDMYKGETTRNVYVEKH